MPDVGIASTVRQWLNLAYPADPIRDERYHIAVQAADGGWSGSAWTRDQVVSAVERAERGGPSGVYLGTCTYLPAAGNRRKATDTAWCYGMWSDVDIAGPGHKHDPGKHKGLGLPPDEESARKIVAASGLPEPTAWIHSGGGLYAWWLLDTPAPAKECGEIAGQWQAALSRAAAEFGWHYGTGVGDLPRVLRLPGTVNRKVVGAPRPCLILSAGGPRHSIGSLRECVAALTPAPKPAPKPATPAGSPFKAPAPGVAGVVLDQFNRVTTWAQILTPHGWQHDSRGDDGTDYWIRPGKDAGKSASTGHTPADTMKCFSDNAGLTTEGTLTKAYVWAALAQGTPTPDMSRAAAELHAAGYGATLPDPSVHSGQSTVDNARVDVDVTNSELAAHKGAGLTDSVLADRLAGELLRGAYVWCAGLGWLAWNGKRWAECTDETVGETVRQWALELFLKVAQGGDPKTIEAWRGILSLGRQRGALTLARGIQERHVEEFDAHPDLINTQTGVVNLRTGGLAPHDPDLLMTKITQAGYEPGATHPDWTRALAAIPEDCHGWTQVRLGQAATGHTPPDDLMVTMQGSGENGKTTILAAAQQALGGYAILLAHRALLASPDAHPTELVDLRGARLAVLEETPEAKRLSVVRLKQIIGTPTIRARRIRRDPVEWKASHTLVLSTNYLPGVEETDHGTWRRLALLTYPYTFRKHGRQVVGPHDRLGDPGLRERCRDDRDVQRAILAWLVDGATTWYAAGKVAPELPARVERDTLKWRGSSDRILSFWGERLAPDRGACVLAEELHAGFNQWITQNGHHEWAKETFTPRFAQHDTTNRHGVEERRTTKIPDVSRWPQSTFQPPRAVGARETVWLNVRFRNASDQPEVTSLPEMPDPKALPPSSPPRERYTEGSGISGRDRPEAGGGIDQDELNGAVFATDPRSIVEGHPASAPSIPGIGDRALGNGCAEPECQRERRRGCRTCADHMTQEMNYT